MLDLELKLPDWYTEMEKEEKITELPDSINIPAPPTQSKVCNDGGNQHDGAQQQQTQYIFDE
jgi:hypothetical protein